MSSHHFVKEGQELPLLVLDWNSKLAEVASQLLGWQPLFIVSETCLEQVLMDGLKPDVILGATDSGVYEYLKPIDFWSDIKRLGDEKYMVITSRSEQECLDWVIGHKDILYTEEKKYYVCPSNKIMKWLPKGSELKVVEIETRKTEVYVSADNGPIEIGLRKNGFVVMEDI